MRPQERQRRPANKEGHADQRIDWCELLRTDERHRQLHRYSFTSAVKIDTVGFAALLKAPLEETDHRATLVAIDRQQPVSELDAPRCRALGIDVRNKPSGAVVSSNAPARSFLDTVVTGHGVDGECEQAGVHHTDEEHEPEEYRSTGMITHLRSPTAPARLTDISSRGALLITISVF